MPSIYGDLFWNQHAREETSKLSKISRMNVNWAELPIELLVRVIENHMLSVDEFAAFSCVCSSWRDATLACDQIKLKQNWARQMPWLMLTDGNEETWNDAEFERYVMCNVFEGSVDEEVSNNVDKGENESNDNTLNRRCMLNLRQKGKCYSFNCPLGYGRVCWGSAHGWIITNGLDDNMYLFNPLTKARLDLPSRCTMPRLCKGPDRNLRWLFIDKAVVLKLPSGIHGNEYDESLLVVLSYYGAYSIAVAKPGDTKWMEIDCRPGSQYQLMDISYLAGDVGAGGLIFVDVTGNLGYLDLHDLQTAVPPKLRWYGCDLKYIVDEFWSTKDGGCLVNEFNTHIIYITHSGQDLLMVLRILELDRNWDDIPRDDGTNIDHYTTVYFKVYKFHFDDKSWEELQDLLDVALFVGNNATMSVCAIDGGCEPNCIYFTDDYRHGYPMTKDRLGGHDMGVFRMDDKIIRPLDVGSHRHTRSSYSCPLWVSPAL